MSVDTFCVLCDVCAGQTSLLFLLADQGHEKNISGLQITVYYSHVMNIKYTFLQFLKDFYCNTGHNIRTWRLAPTLEVLLVSLSYPVPQRVPQLDLDAQHQVTRHQVMSAPTSCKFSWEGSSMDVKFSSKLQSCLSDSWCSTIWKTNHPSHFLGVKWMVQIHWHLCD